MHSSFFYLDYVVSFVLLILILVFVHEYGHFLFARLFGVKVEVFSIGFGRRLLSFKDKHATVWQIAPIPLGGYVKMQGEMLPFAPEERDERFDSFHNKRIWEKMLIVLAGPLFNLLLPLVIFFIIAFLVGVPHYSPEVGTVLPHSSAYKILQPKDQIKSVNGQEVNSFYDVRDQVIKHPGEFTIIKILRNHKPLTLKLKIGPQKQGNQTIGVLGITANEQSTFNQRFGLIKSVSMSGRMYVNTLYNIFNGFKMLLTRHFSLDDLGGPIKIFQISGETAQHGLAVWLTLLAALSINLAIINLFPIPGLDGGLFLLYLVEAMIRRPLPVSAYKVLVATGYMLIIALMILVTGHDILRLFD